MDAKFQCWVAFAAVMLTELVDCAEFLSVHVTPLSELQDALADGRWTGCKGL